METLFIASTVAIVLASFASSANAQTVPSSWTRAESGIVKGTSKVTINGVQDVGEQSPAAFLSALEMTAPEGAIFVSSGGIKDGKYVTQVKREITVDGTAARSVLMLCNGGANEHRLIDVFSENAKVMDLIIGAKYAISVCAE